MFHEVAGEDLYARLAEFDPTIIGISTMTPSFPAGKMIASTIKAVRDDVVIILGGWHASGCVAAHEKGQEEESLKEILGEESPFDYVVSGEGDLVLPEIVSRIDEGLSIDDIPGVGYLDVDGIRLNSATRIRDLDVLADPSWEGLNIDEYIDQRTEVSDLSVHFNRACRFNCGFCSTPTVYGKGVTTFSPSRAIEYISKLVAEKNPQVITFTDEDFFARMSWVIDLVSLMEERGFGESVHVHFDTFASVNDLLRVDDALLKRMKKVGFNIFTIGVESFNNKTLGKYNKKPMINAMLTPEQRTEKRDLSGVYFECVQRAIDKVQRHGILVMGDYILGNLGESEEEVMEGFSKFISLKGLLLAYIPTFTPFPGTALWKESYDSGKLARLPNGGIDWSRFDASAGALDLGYDVGKLRNELELSFYTSQRYLDDMFEILKNCPERKAMFIGRFKRLQEVFGGNEVVDGVLERLKG